MKSSKVKFVVFTVVFVVVVISLVSFFYNSFGKPEGYAFFWDYPRGVEDFKDYEAVSVPSEAMDIKLYAFSKELKIDKDAICFVDAKIDEKSESVYLIYWTKIFNKGEEIVYKAQSESKNLSDMIKVPLWLKVFKLKDYSKFHLEEIKTGSNQIRAVISYIPNLEYFWTFTAILVVILGIGFYFLIFHLF